MQIYEFRSAKQLGISVGLLPLTAFHKFGFTNVVALLETSSHCIIYGQYDFHEFITCKIL